MTDDDSRYPSGHSEMRGRRSSSGRRPGRRRRSQHASTSRQKPGEDIEELHERLRHRPARRPGDGRDRRTPTSLYLLAVLGIVIGLYAVFLAVSFFRKPQTKTAARPEPVAAETNVVPEEVYSPEDEAASIKADILTWNRVQYAMDESKRLLKDGLLEQAERGLNRMLVQAPDMAELHLARAKVLVEQARFDEAKEELRTTLARDPADEEARIMLATILSAQGNYAASLPVAEWILASDAYSVEAHRVAAKAFLNTDRAKLAIAHLRRIVNLEGGNVLAENTLAVAYCRTEEYAKATDILKRLLVRDSSNSITYYNLAVCYSYQAQAENVVEVLNNAVAVFGKPFVKTWLKSPDFDTVRGNGAFIAFLQSQGLEEMATEEEGPVEPS